MGQLWEPGTVVGLLGAHKLVVTPPDIVCLGRGHRRTFQTEDGLETFPRGSGIKEQMKEGPEEKGDTRGMTDAVAS